ncbi:hypothetical protein Bca4012_019093 [Brassica carinata]
MKRIPHHLATSSSDGPYSVTTNFVSVTSTVIGFVSGILRANSCSSLSSVTNPKLISPLSHSPSVESYSNL